jgi:hypothetical protein
MSRTEKTIVALYAVVMALIATQALAERWAK